MLRSLLLLISLFCTSLYAAEFDFEGGLSAEEIIEFRQLMSDLSSKDKQSRLGFFHIVKEVDLSTYRVTLEDGSVWQIGWWYTGCMTHWQPGHLLKIFYHPNYSTNIELENQNVQDGPAWGNLYKKPDEHSDYVMRIPNGKGDTLAWQKLVLRSGLILKTQAQQGAVHWKARDKLFVFHTKQPDFYDLWNTTQNRIEKNWQLIGNEKPVVETVDIEVDVLNLEEKLNQKVLLQKEATQAVAASILNYYAGVKDSNTPIGVFLFLGPTGVGKTELAKVLSEELYRGQDRLIRFDMSHFNVEYAITRLIGSPPGYVNYEDGGQLTEALKNKPQSVVLLDEIEKAHPAVRKLFLPVFDEGYITDSKDYKIQCQHTVFIMTSNLCSQEVTRLFGLGYSSQQVLETIEPMVMETLSPELYNRVETVVFRPLNHEVMDSLVDLMLRKLTKRLEEKKKIALVFDKSARSYLSQKGFHPDLGARPLKKLIEKKVLPALSRALIKEKIPAGSTVTMAYLTSTEAWEVRVSEVVQQQ